MLMPYEISEAGTVSVPIDAQNKMIQDALHQAKERYQAAGYKRPWISFLAFEKGACVGTCGFNGAPKDGKVEIFYLPFPGTPPEVPLDMVRKIIEILHFNDRNAVMVTRTLAVENEFVQFLKELGLTHQVVNDSQGNQIWEWSLVWGGHKRMANAGRK